MELIDRQELVKNFRRISVLDVFPEWKTMNPSVTAAITRLCRKYREIILEAPTVEAVSVVHGNWNIRCEAHRDNHTGEVDEEFYIECSECHRKVWDVSQSDVLLGRYGKICNDYPYCHCGAKMDGCAEDG